MTTAKKPKRQSRSTTELAATAAWVLGSNDTGTMVTAAPKLYPHMWSWDAAFISIGLAHLDVRRATSELDVLLESQWNDGMIPHIVFQEGADYFPGPDRWGAAELSPSAPGTLRTSGICQPPVHAIAVRRIIDVARRCSDEDRDVTEDFLQRTWPKLYRWHEWLVHNRDPREDGSIAIVHGWESGMDNSPRWDEPYASVQPGPNLPPYARRDRGVVGDDSQRPSDTEYDRYLWLVEEMRRVRYQPDEVVRTSSFLVADVFFTAVFAVASDVLAELGTEINRDKREIANLRKWADRARTAVTTSCDPRTGMARDRDLRADRWLTSHSIAGFAPLLCGGLDTGDELRLLDTLSGDDWSSHPHILAAVPPSVSPAHPKFRPREYWRGPQWPFMTWLLYWTFARHGWSASADQLRTEGLKLVADNNFAEYYEPFTGEPLGSTNQSWTAAVTLDWLCFPDDRLH